MHSDEIRTAAEQFALQLGESTPDPVKQITMLMHHLGIDMIRQKVEETLQIEQQGGIMTQDGTRRRTPGGVFFFIVKRDMDPELRLQVFPNFGQGRKKGATIEWENRMEILEPLMSEERGKANQIRVHLQGRPGKVEVIEDSVVMIFEHFNEASPEDEDKAGLPQMPRGVPAPPVEPTRYIVYMGINQWERVHKHLEHPKDQLMIEGVMFYDHATESIAVFSLGVTTRELERRQRRQEKMLKQQAEQKAASAAKATKQSSGGGAPKRDKPAKQFASASVSMEMPDGAPPEVTEQLQKLYAAVDTYRERIAAKEAQGQKPAMEQRLLQTIEKQIEALRKQYP
jgi:hypothetical protein